MITTMILYDKNFRNARAFSINILCSGDVDTMLKISVFYEAFIKEKGHAAG